jgi:hypothetical protein
MVPKTETTAGSVTVSLTSFAALSIIELTLAISMVRSLNSVALCRTGAGAAFAPVPFIRIDAKEIPSGSLRLTELERLLPYGFGAGEESRICAGIPKLPFAFPLKFFLGDNALRAALAEIGFGIIAQ